MAEGLYPQSCYKQTNTCSHSHTHINKQTLRYIQAFGDTFEGDAVTPEGQHRAMGACGPEEVGFTAVNDIT